ncbi:MAG: hypothetical protein M3N32_08950 [Actinomycetota bacterium]|nr:hypothetical protein [Actinomycetota bacterium]
MPVFALLYPSPSLALLGDPREVAARLGGADHPVPAENVLAEVRERRECPSSAGLPEGVGKSGKMIVHGAPRILSARVNQA